MAAAVEGAAGEEAAPPPPLVLPLHATIRTLQLKNGLRHGDYQRYRHYTTRRLRRLRKHVKATHHCKGRTFTVKPLTMQAVGGPDRLKLDHLLLALLNAERAWSFAMHLKQEGGDSNSSGKQQLNAKRKNHLKRRMRRAAAWARKLQELATEAAERVSERSLLEVEAYCSWMGAVLQVEAEGWGQALAAFNTAHSILARLAEVGTLEEQDLFSTRAEEVAQSIRFCHYNLGQGSLQDTQELLSELTIASSGKSSSGDQQQSAAAAVPLGLRDKLEAVLATSRKEQAEHMGAIQWGRHCTIPPITSQDIAVAVLKVLDAVKLLLGQQDEEEDSSGQAAADNKYTAVYSAYDDAAGEVARELASLAGMTSGAKVEEKKQQLTTLQSWLQHGKLSTMMRRNEALVHSLLRRPQESKKAEDIVHVYDALVQNVSDILKLPGMEDLDDILTHTQALEVCFRAHRCYHLADFYASPQRRQLAESLVLYELSVSLADQALALLDDDDDEQQQQQQQQGGNSRRKKGLEQLRTLAAGGRYRVQALSLLHTLAATTTTEEEEEAATLTQSSDTTAAIMTPLMAASALGAITTTATASSSSSATPLLNRLDQYQVGSESGGYGLPSLPPALELVGGKPQLFDLAMNHVRDALPHDAHASASGGAPSLGEQGKQTSKGFFGWLTG